MKLSISGKLLFAGWLLVSIPAGAVENISLQALFKDKAIILVDGARRVLKSGEESPEGIKLLATDTREESAEIEVGGRRETLRLGVVTAGFSSKGKGGVTLYAEKNGHYYADGIINGVTLRFLVDTGATAIALSSDMARRIGLDYRKHGRPAYVQTANGVTTAYFLKLENVTVGDITLYNVDAGIQEGNSINQALLGMSFLGRLDMRHDGEKLELKER